MTTSSARAKPDTLVEIIGVHPVEAKEPCHLVELWIRDCAGSAEMSDFTQADPNTTSSNWQVPWDDSFLNADGDEVVGEVMLEGDRNPTLWRGDVRIAFFFPYLACERPLQTPFGEVALPKASKRPERLRCMAYEPPD